MGVEKVYKRVKRDGQFKKSKEDCVETQLDELTKLSVESEKMVFETQCNVVKAEMEKALPRENVILPLEFKHIYQHPKE